MNIVTGLIGSGKTVEAIKHCAKQRLTMVVEFEHAKKDFNEMARTIKCGTINVITYREFIDRHGPKARGSTDADGYFIENISRFFGYVYGVGAIGGFTCDGEDLVVTVRDEKLGFYKKDLYQL